jgi:hydrogenase/urease accessory protein HupE
LAKRPLTSAWIQTTPGFEHILTGPDHLLFLLTIVVAGAGWRYWLSAVTAFTLAHSITLLLSVCGLVHVAPAVVEPAIAASIVVMAAVNLLRPEAPGRWRLRLVFGCGLLHGLGFSSALRDMALDRTHLVTALAGFNVVIEIGQFVFIGAIVCSLNGLRNVSSRSTAGNYSRVASALAAVFGCIMLLQRII